VPDDNAAVTREHGYRLGAAAAHIEEKVMDAVTENTTSRAPGANRKDVRSLARRQVMMLSAQFLLGMAVALIGVPSETTGAAHTASNVLLGLHILVAIAIVALAVRTIQVARVGGEGARRPANWGAVTIGLTFVAGVITAMTKNNWWSYAMAVGFIASLLLYGSLLVRAQRPARQPG
jgi:O-antigen/teichoic acid export membrane protein